VEDLCIRNLAIGDVSADVRIHNKRGEISVTAESADSDIAVRLTK
jgi:hypothetical protein